MSVVSNDAGDNGAPAIKVPSLVDVLIPIGTLVALLALSVIYFGEDSSYGPNQVALIVATVVACLVAGKNGHRWEDLNDAIGRGIALALGAMLILLAVGALIGSWMVAGTVPAMIHYGLKVLDPSIFYAAACVICALVALCIGSSWTVAGTIGIALIGVAVALGLRPEITAGAIISGAYFGDKMSPLSDTTNLAPAVTGTELFTHIRHMAWTTGPSFIIALTLFVIIGLASKTSGEAVALAETSALLTERFHVSVLPLLPVVLLLWMAVKRIHALPTILAGAGAGLIMAAVLQPDRVVELAASADLTRAEAIGKGLWIALFDGYTSTTGNTTVDALLSRGGMISFLNTIFLIITALSFGAVMEHTGLLERLISGMVRAAHSVGALVASVVGTTMMTNAIASDQYMAVVVPGRMFKAEFKRRRLKARNLSRTIEDAGTLTSPLVPWNTCGAYMAATLGVPTFAYLPFCFLNLVNPLIAMFYGFRGIKIDRYAEDEPIPEVDRA